MPIAALISQAAAAQARLDRLNGIETAEHHIHEHRPTLKDHALAMQGVPREQRLRVVD